MMYFTSQESNVIRIKYCTIKKFINFGKKMNHISIVNAEALASTIEGQLESSKESRLFIKLYTILLVARHPDNNCSEVARLLGASPHTVARWVRRVCVKNGFDLTRLDDKIIPGRPRRLDENQLSIIKDVIAKSPKGKGFQSLKWTGSLLSDYLKREFDIDLQVRQCQKLLVQLSAQKKIDRSH
jgi:transposase